MAHAIQCQKVHLSHIIDPDVITKENNNDSYKAAKITVPKTKKLS